MDLFKCQYFCLPSKKWRNTGYQFPHFSLPSIPRRKVVRARILSVRESISDQASQPLFILPWAALAINYSRARDRDVMNYSNDFWSRATLRDDFVVSLEEGRSMATGCRTRRGKGPAIPLDKRPPLQRRYRSTEDIDCLRCLCFPR